MPEYMTAAQDYIVPLNINGLQGRMMRVPSSSKKANREILFIYGHHAMLERWWTLVESLNKYGNVTMPDLPGFGGMESFQKIGIEPNIDAFADYLAAFIKLRYKRQRISIYAISYGFVVITRMLQRYPDMAKRIDLLINVVGFMHADDFHWSPTKRRIFRAGALFFATRPVAFLIRYAFLNKPVVKTLTGIMPHSKHRFIAISPEEFEATMNFEVQLWQANDVRTHFLTSSEFFTLDNTKTTIALPVIHVISSADHYFNNIKIEQHMRQVFKDYIPFVAKTNAHTPHITADKKTNAVLIPPGLRKMLNEKTK